MTKTTKARGYYAAVGTDGVRLVIWGLGRTPDVAKRDSIRWLTQAAEDDGGPMPLAMRIYPMTEAAFKAARDGHIQLERGYLWVDNQDEIIRIPTDGTKTNPHRI